MSRALIVAAGLAMACATFAPAALAQEVKTVEAAKIFPYLDKFLTLPPQERTRFKLSYGLQRDGKMAPDVKATLVEAGGARTPLPIGPDGFFERTPTQAQLAARAAVSFDVPASVKLGMMMRFDPVLKPASEYAANDLVATVDEANRAIGKAAGPMAMLAPKMAGLRFPGAGAGRVVFADGREQPLPVERTSPVFRPDEAKGAVRVRLDRAPTKVGFAGKKK
ncbi:MAG: hypothetical protein JWP92_1926 [Caulobacter sp.]|nr:hypothetical protein [Caulobacter sp.]